MLENLKLALELIKDAVQQHNLRALFHQQIFHNRIAVPILLDLNALDTSKNLLPNPETRFIELRWDDIQNKSLTFFMNARRLDALRNLRRGLRGFAFITPENVVIGDIWCLTPNATQTPIKHPDLVMLGLQPGAADVYVLDMYIPTNYRGKKLATPLHRSMQAVLSREGWQTLYAYYWEDNLASKWTHWMLKCTELPKLKISRFFFYKATHPYS